MITDSVAIQLHDRATRGGQLTDEERAALAAWYRLQDEQEAALLSRGPASPSLAALQAEIAALTTRIRLEADRIAALTAQNAALRREVATLERQLPPVCTTPNV